MKISELSRLSGIPKRTIQFYIQENLLKPETNPENNYHDFDQDDLRRLKLIRSLRNAGLPVTMIRSLLEKPAAASYYLNLFLRQLYLKQKHLTEIIELLGTIEEDLPVHTDYETILQIFEKTDLPALSEIEMDDYDKYDNSLVNYFLWGRFLPDTDFTEYQEYLWKKIDRQTRRKPAREYMELCRFLKQLDPVIVNRLYSESREYEEIASCNDQTFPILLDTFKKEILRFLKSPDQILVWKKYYHSFLLPNTVIYASEISDLVGEISPFFIRYRTSIHRLCSALYAWLSEEKPELLKEMHRILDPCCDIDSYHHGLLAVMISMSSFTSLLP